jgi:hypothetical protein
MGGKGIVEEQVDLVDIMVGLLQRSGLHDGHLRFRQPLPKAPAHLLLRTDKKVLFFLNFFLVG